MGAGDGHPAHRAEPRRDRVRHGGEPHDPETPKKGFINGFIKKNLLDTPAAGRTQIKHISKSATSDPAKNPDFVQVFPVSTTGRGIIFRLYSGETERGDPRGTRETQGEKPTMDVRTAVICGKQCVAEGKIFKEGEGGWKVAC